MRLTAFVLFFMLLFTAPASSAESAIRLSSGQTVYVAIYSNVFIGPKEHPFKLTATLSIRNTDLHNSLNLLSVEYFDNNGKTLKEYVNTPIALAPLASRHFSVKESGEPGGFGANFIVRWKSAKEINAPIIQSVMIGGTSGQGISFVSEGVAIDENTK